MKQLDCDTKLANIRLLPVVKVPKLENASPLADALEAGGIPLIEVTLRSECALSAIQTISKTSSIALGAGTVMNVEQAKAAHQAGATFLVCPGLDEQIVRYCLDQELAIYPGVSTASEVQKAYNLGLRSVKLFPAEAVGGVPLLKALSAPFAEMKFVPTGGVSLVNIVSYLSVKATLAVGGSWMTAEKLYQSGDYSAVTSAAQEAVAKLS
ncbi:UNVERIFIED_CONTAM: hypothetical protein GTU68_019208 [Idotea baltica]|nr:hypothetical protein [Idotea baltica]